jgi:hypothetical protein
MYIKKFGTVVVETKSRQSAARAALGRLVMGLLFGSLLGPFTMEAANRYVDTHATGKGRAEDGSSWVNAWTNLSALDWSRISAGTTVWIAGGGGRAYSSLEVPRNKSGTAAMPITFRVGQDAGYNGRFRMAGINIGANSNIVVNGALDPAFSIPASLHDLWSITNNIGIDIQTTGHGVYATHWEGSKMLWLDIGPCGVPGTDDRRQGVWINTSSSGNYIRDGEIAYCYIHHTTKDGINNNGVPGGSRVVDWDLMHVHHNIITMIPDDGIIYGTFGLTFHHNIVGPKRLDVSTGHPDSAQPFNFGKHRLYNNILFNPQNAWLYSSLTTFTEDSTIGDFHFYGNICYTERDWPIGPSQNYGVHLAGYAGTANNKINVDHAYFTNAVFLHNTVYNCRGEGMALYNSDGKDGNALYSMTVTNTAFYNNLLLDVAYNYGGAALRIGGKPSTYVNDSVAVDYNVVAGPNPRIALGSTFANAAAMAAATRWKSNRNEMPLVVSTNSYDFRLQAGDTVARNRGLDLSHLMATMPGLDTDLWGNPRGADGAWDIGAHEYTAGDLVLWLRFDDDLSEGTALDSSGRGNHGSIFGRAGSTTNWPVATDVAYGANGTSQAAAFNYYWDGYGEYGRSGDYIGVTNINEGMVSEMTIMLWAKYDAAHNSSGAPAPWTQDHNATLVDNGRYLTAGGWRLGRENFWSGAVHNNKTKWTVFSGSSAASRLQMTFQDTGDSNGATAQMNHYAVVFNRGTNWLYLNGSLVQSNLHSQTQLQLNTRSHWLGIGAWPHHGSMSRDPWLTTPGSAFDEYPNAFWFKGKMDDVRLYKRALSAGEVKAIHDSAGAESLGPLEPPERLRLAAP